MIITESQLRKIIQEEAEKAICEQIVRELEERFLNEGKIKDILQGLVKKHGPRLVKKAVTAALTGSIALSTLAPGLAQADPGDVAAQLRQMDAARDAAPTQVAQAEVEDGYAVEGDIHMFRVTGERGDQFAQRDARDGLQQKLVGAGGPLEGERSTPGLKYKGWIDGQHTYTWSEASAATAQQLMQMMNR